MKKKRRESAIQQASSMVMGTEADWSELPMDLLYLILQRIDNEIDLIRFRSICTNWRSSSIPNHYRNILTIKLPSHFCNLSKHSFFLIKPPQVRRRGGPWLLKITQNSTGKTQFHHPLRRYGLRSPSHPIFFDFNEFSLLHLTTNFIYHYEQVNPTKAIAVTSHGNKPIILGTVAYSGVEFKCGDENWKAIPNMSAYLGDICVFKGRPYAVDKTGQTVTVGLGPDNNSTVELVAESLVDGGDIKFLVESKGDLLLADVYDCLFRDDDGIKRVRIDVFKLNGKEKKWVKLANIGDRVLFLGSLCSFSASASDLCVPKGNCVIIMDDIFARAYCRWSSFLDLDDRRLLTLSKCPEYFKLFRTPPKWIKKLN